MNFEIHTKSHAMVTELQALFLDKRIPQWSIDTRRNSQFLQIVEEYTIRALNIDKIKTDILDVVITYFTKPVRKSDLSPVIFRD